MATHSRILAWRIPWTKEPGGPQSMGVSKESDIISRLRAHASTEKVEKPQDKSNIMSPIKLKL